MPETIYDKAALVVSQRKKMREAELTARKNEVFEKIPRIMEIENELDRFGIRMLSLVADGKCDENRAVAGIMAENKQYVEERARLLSIHGYSEDYLDPKPFCDKCGDTGFVGEKLCQCMKKEIAACALRDANLSSVMVGQRFENFSLDYYSGEYVSEYGCSPKENMSAILNECLQYARNFPDVTDNLLFCGGCGLGKTFLSSAIANELLEKGVDVLYVSSNALFPILEDMHFGREVSDRSEYIVKKLNDCDLLILDDLGSEFVTQFTCAELFRIINNRLLSGKKMIISTNLNENMLKGTYNERIASRITGGFSILEFLGKDIRKKKKFETHGE